MGPENIIWLFPLSSYRQEKFTTFFYTTSKHPNWRRSHPTWTFEAVPFKWCPPIHFCWDQIELAANFSFFRIENFIISFYSIVSISFHSNGPRSLKNVIFQCICFPNEGCNSTMNVQCMTPIKDEKCQLIPNLDMNNESLPHKPTWIRETRRNLYTPLD